MVRVLVVEDAADMRQALSNFLVGKGYIVTAVDSTEDGIDQIDEHDFDIGLIDINLPGKSGFEMIEYIREQQKTMPLIALTARSEIEDKLHGFELGVTDYIVKPFDLQELAARMRTHLQSTGPTNESADIETTSYSLSPLRHEFLIQGKAVELTNTEFRMAQLLLLNHGAVVNATELIEFVWGEAHITDTPPIRIHIANLRRKLGDSEFKIIKTIPGIGYKLDDPAGGSHAATS